MAKSLLIEWFSIVLVSALFLMSPALAQVSGQYLAINAGPMNQAEINSATTASEFTATVDAGEYYIDQKTGRGSYMIGAVAEAERQKRIEEAAAAAEQERLDKAAAVAEQERLDKAAAAAEQERLDKAAAEGRSIERYNTNTKLPVVSPDSENPISWATTAVEKCWDYLSGVICIW